MSLRSVIRKSNLKMPEDQASKNGIVIMEALKTERGSSGTYTRNTLQTDLFFVETRSARFAFDVASS